MHYRAAPWIQVGLCLLACVGTAFAQQGDERVVAAREAFRVGDQLRLEHLAIRSEAHPLDPYVTHWLWLNRIARPTPLAEAALLDFLRNHRDTVVAERVRMAWLKRLASERRWLDFESEYALLQRPDDELRCLAWQARQARGDASLRAEIAAQWLELGNSHTACVDVLRSMANRGEIDTEQLWWRIRRQIDSRQPADAKLTARWLPAAEAPSASALDQLIKSPALYLDRLPGNFATSRSGRELAIAALTRLAREDADAAQLRLFNLSGRLPQADRSYVHAVLGHHGAQSRNPLAWDWFEAAGDLPLTAAQRNWRVRAALRIENWSGVAEAIDALPDDERAQPEWIYWRARAHAAAGDNASAERLLRRLMGETHFYGLLAAEELGQLFEVPAIDPEPTPAARARALSEPALTRALALYRLEMPVEAVREWIWAVRGKDVEFLAAASHIAHGLGLYDRAINTAELVGPRAQFGLRFITPYRDIIEPEVLQQNLDLAWVYGLMRQESRFIVPARSSAGAQGLMQVMPATGKWVARKIGLDSYHPSMLSDPHTNVLLGTSYMRLIMEDLDRHPVLASAGYNAGPGRAARWRDQRPLEGAIYVETIPFDETRDYVRKVLANAVIYAAMFERKPQSLKRRLGVINPAPGGS